MLAAGRRAAGNIEWEVRSSPELGHYYLTVGGLYWSQSVEALDVASAIALAGRVAARRAGGELRVDGLAVRRLSPGKEGGV